MKAIDNFLDNTTMYRVVLYALTILALISIVFGFTGISPFSGVAQITSLVVIIFSCFISNLAISKIFKIPANIESQFITGFILFLILIPSLAPIKLLYSALTGFIAMASKYVLIFRKRHVFNPTAISLVIMGLLGIGSGIWWVANPYLAPLCLIFGALIVRKIRQTEMVLAFVATATIFSVIANWQNAGNVIPFLKEFAISWPVIFFATIMLTEPLTTPPSKKWQIIYGGIVGVLFATQFHFGPIYSSPELALVLGNIFSFAISPKYRLLLKLNNKKEIATNTLEFSFPKEKGFKFISGQYMEWTLAHEKPDTRGYRRFFTIASSPTESEIKIAVRIDPNKGSTFKRALTNSNGGAYISASSLSGNFILPKNKAEKLIFISGGIGVTPFRSIIKYLIDSGEQRDIVLFYSNKTVRDIAFKEIFDSASNNQLKLKTVYTLTDVNSTPNDWTGEKGFVDEKMIKKYAPDYLERKFYISGPPVMVNAFKTLLKKMGVSRGKIKTDFFQGYA